MAASDVPGADGADRPDPAAADGSPADGSPGGRSPDDWDPVDWELAARTARRLVRPGPAMSLTAAAAVVEQLRSLADEAAGHVERYTGLRATDDVPVAVVDRPEWARSNIASLRLLTGPLLARLGGHRLPSGPGAAVGRRVTGGQVGVALAYLAGKVLGQYEVFLPPEEGGGRLSLVAPNIVAAERVLGVDPRDFRLWVCLHEQTHRTQFAAVPWLRGHLEAEIRTLVEVSDLDPSVLAQRLRGALGAVADGVRGRGDAPSLLEALQTPAQRAVLDRLTAVMTLLEGHAEQVMDAVGPQVVPTVGTIRERFDARRAGGSPVDRLLRRLLGLDLKLEQYRAGGAFVRAVVAEVGVDGFNRVWDSPTTLPTRAEIADHRGWLARVCGGTELPAPPAA